MSRQSVWDQIPDSGRLERGLSFWSGTLGDQALGEWIKRGILTKLAIKDVLSTTRTVDVGDGMLKYDLETDVNGILAVSMDAPSRIVTVDDPRIAFARFNIVKYLDQLASANSVTERPSSANIGVDGVYALGDSRIGGAIFSWTIVLSRHWLGSVGAQSYFSASRATVNIVLVGADFHVPNQPNLAALRLPIENMALDRALYCRRDLGVDFDDVKPLFSATKKIVIEKETGTIIMLGHPIKVRNSMAKRHEFLIALVEHGRHEPQQTIPFAVKHLSLDANIQDVLHKVRSYKSELRDDFDVAFAENKSCIGEIEAALFDTEDANVVCKFNREDIIIW